MPEVTYQNLPLILHATFAAGIGLLIGLEREHHDSDARTRAAGVNSDVAPLLGVRTFGLLAVFGWAAAYASASYPWLPVAAFVAGSALVTVAAVQTHGNGRALTTEVAALTTLLLGMLVHTQRSIAVALAVLTTLLLMSKPFFREIVPRMRRVDLTATLQLLVLLAIVLPLLPEQARDPWGVLSPRRIGVFVALVAGIGYVGYVLHRVLGARRSAGLTGLVGGFVSSTAVTAAMAQQARSPPSLRRPGQLATLLANTIMFVRVVVVSSLLDVRMIASLALPFAMMALCTLCGALWSWRRMNDESAAQSEGHAVELSNPFSLLPALQWGALLAIILVASAVARNKFGDSGFIATAALSGLIDVDAMTVIATRAMSAGEIDISLASLAITVAVASNTMIKSAIALIAGGSRFGVFVASVLGVTMLVGIVTAALAT